MRTAILFAFVFTLGICATGSSLCANQGMAATHPTIESLRHGMAARRPERGRGARPCPGTLVFPELGKVAGSGSCNRFVGAAEIGEGTIRFGELATTRRACLPAVMDQETRYLKALEDAERIVVEGPYLLIYSKGIEKPLRFTRKSP